STIKFLDIPEIIGEAMEKHTAIKSPSLEEILDTEKAAYEFIESRW
ncbi:MAG TPA: 1-deoxy-D-xylulose-5-phosphate reductoisomerase, partial [Lachnospiraceae bacterium]|nr:1-deoxy-D-xylulose-5-phosphate reductoisomerase [Lachnospiraceae bacterium]